MTNRSSELAVTVLAVGLALASCASPAPSATQGQTAGPSAASSTPDGSTAPSAAPGRPYDAAAVLAAMRDSRRPGGVAQELQTQEIAGLVAEQLWTWDGTAWEQLAVGGSCGAGVCSLEVSGSTDGTAGADLYAFSIDASAGSVELATADLHAYPMDLDTILDGVARGMVNPTLLEGMALVGARWLPPPDAGHYWLSYRSGGEEGSPGLDVLLDLPGEMVLETREPG